MSALNINGIEYPLTEEGRLESTDNWNKDVAIALADKEGITLTEPHWEIVCFLRNYYQQYGLVPASKLFKKAFSHEFSADKTDDAYLNNLFPGGISQQASRIAGLPSPLVDEFVTNNKPRKAVMTGSASVSDLMHAFEFEGQTYHLTPSGNLVEREAWNEKLAGYLAETQGITLKAEHWEIINFIRGFYAEYAIAPMIKLLIKHLRQSGMDPAKCSKAYLYELFPGGPARQGSLIGGLAEPPGCID